MGTKLKNTLLLFTFFFGLGACKDKEENINAENNYGPTTYKGKVYERGSTVGIANCPVLIHGYILNGPLGSPDMPTVAQTFSDSNGHFTLSWNAQKGKRYFIYPESPKHYGNSKGQPVWELNQFGKTISKDVEQWALAYVKMKLLNRQKNKNYTHFTGGSSLNGITLPPGSKDTNFIAVVWGNISDTIKYGIYNGLSLQKKYKFGFNVQAWETDSITIEY